MNKLLIIGSTLLVSASMLAQDSPSTPTSTNGTPAATSSSTTPAKKPLTISQRKRNQQRRIANGVKSGQLTPGETANLEKKEQALNQEEKDMRKLDNGHLTKQDRKTLNQQQNQLSKKIYKDKHNDKKQAGTK